MCSLMINGRPHGGQRATTTCQLHMRLFNDGDEIWIEPWRADRVPGDQGSRASTARAFDRVIAAGGFITANVGSAPDAQRHPRSRRRRPTARWTPPRASAAAPASPRARTARRCCSSPRSSSHLHHLPQGQPERMHRTQAMVTRDGRRRLRQLLEPLRVRGRVPEGDPARRDGADRTATTRRPRSSTAIAATSPTAAPSSPRVPPGAAAHVVRRSALGLDATTARSTRDRRSIHARGSVRARAASRRPRTARRRRSRSVRRTRPLRSRARSAFARGPSHRPIAPRRRAANHRDRPRRRAR